MKILLFTLSLLCILISCGNKKRQALADETAIVTDDVAATLFDIDTVPPAMGVKYTGIRSIDPANPPIVLDLTKTPSDEKFDFANYYDTVEYMKIKLPDEVSIKFGDRVTNVIGVTDKYIIARGVYEHVSIPQIYPALYCFDRQGNYLYRIKKRDTPPLREDGIPLVGHYTSKSLRSPTSIGDNCLFRTLQENESLVHFLSLSAGKVYSSRDSRNMYPYIVDSTTFATNNYGIFNDEFLYTINSKGDTLSTFKSYNPVVKNENKDGGKGLEEINIYYYNSQLTLRQPYNDTIFRVVSEKQIRPAFILKMGSKKLDPYTAMYGNHESKIRIRDIFEEQHFLYVYYTVGGKYFYGFYDKATQKFHIGEGWSTRQNLKNSIANALPFNLGAEVQIDNNSVYASYSKKEIAKFIELKSEVTEEKYNEIYTVAQQEMIEYYNNNLEEDECLLMLLKKGGK